MKVLFNQSQNESQPETTSVSDALCLPNFIEVYQRDFDDQRMTFWLFELDEYRQFILQSLYKDF